VPAHRRRERRRSGVQPVAAPRPRRRRARGGRVHAPAADLAPAAGRAMTDDPAAARPAGRRADAGAAPTAARSPSHAKPPARRRRLMDVNTWILLALTLGALVFAYARRPSLAADGLVSGGRLLRGVAPELLLGFALAGLVDVLIPSETLVRWL